MSEDKSLRRPIIDPLLLALKSRRVLVALCTLVIGVLVMAVPEIQPVRGELLTLLITLALAVIGGYSLEDAAHAGRDNSAVSSEDLRGLIKDALNDFVNEIGKPPSNPNPQP
jgi:hypothetical protein